jgi:hypothetical protein
MSRETVSSSGESSSGDDETLSVENEAISAESETPVPAAKATAAPHPATNPYFNRMKVSNYTYQRSLAAPQVTFSKYAFNGSKRDIDVAVSQGTADKNKSISRKRLEKTLDFCGTLEHQASLIGKICTTGKRAGIGIALGMLPDPDLTKEVGSMVVANAKEILQDPCCGSRQTNDAMSFRHTGYFLMGPTAPPANAPEHIKAMFDDSINKYVQVTRTQKNRLKEASVNRWEFFELKAERRQIEGVDADLQACLECKEVDGRVV